MVGFPITVWGAGLDFEITDAEASQYNADPDGFVARRWGFSGANEYYEWLNLQGAPLCGGITRAGKPRKALTGGYQLNLEEWRAKHRAHYCRAHGGGDD
jgi:hypothetical protein